MTTDLPSSYFAFQLTGSSLAQFYEITGLPIFKIQHIHVPLYSAL